MKESVDVIFNYDDFKECKSHFDCAVVANLKFIEWTKNQKKVYALSRRSSIWLPLNRFTTNCNSGSAKAEGIVVGIKKFRIKKFKRK